MDTYLAFAIFLFIALNPKETTTAVHTPDVVLEERGDTTTMAIQSTARSRIRSLSILLTPPALIGKM